ncbi:MarR family transcriptional regulator [Micromonospora sp. NPDC000119]|uniref:MarR family transcriptional regulator n=1 Tax=Micromonospora sp. NPDC000119 TaxID=3154242 RepID=UPI0033300F4D
MDTRARSPAEPQPHAVGHRHGADELDQRRRELGGVAAPHALARGGPAAASAPVQRVGLTPGTLSRMIDRLDAAGCMKRTPDPADRRILIEPTALLRFIEAASRSATSEVDRLQSGQRDHQS